MYYNKNTPKNTPGLGHRPDNFIKKDRTHFCAIFFLFSKFWSDLISI